MSTPSNKIHGIIIGETKLLKALMEGVAVPRTVPHLIKISGLARWTVIKRLTHWHTEGLIYINNWTRPERGGTWAKCYAWKCGKDFEWDAKMPPPIPQTELRRIAKGMDATDYKIRISTDTAVKMLGCLFGTKFTQEDTNA